MSTVVGWWIYCVVVAGLFGLGAMALDASLRAQGRPGRWVWLGALVLSLVVPLWAWLGLRTWSAPITTIPGTAVLTMAPLTVTGAEVGGGIDIRTVLLVGWAVLSGLLAGWIVLNVMQLVAAKRGWRSLEMDGVRVLVTRDVGPAVIGVRRGAILMPEWVFALERRIMDLLFLHEREHLRVGDPRLLFGGLLLVLVAPWNPVLWWQLRRLRLAVEMDCDARVLAAKPDAVRYGALLLEVGQRRGGAGLVVAFAEPATFLERRIRVITRGSKRSLRRAVGLGGMGLGLVALAVCTEEPRELPSETEAEVQAEPDTRVLVVPPVPLPDPSAEPSYTPMTDEPVLENRAEVQRLLKLHYPPLLRDAGLGGQATIWFYIDETGRVGKAQVKVPSEFPQLDEAALKVAHTMRFTPAKSRDEVVAVWVAIPIVFNATGGSGTVESPPPIELPPPPVGVSQYAGRVYTPKTDEPVVENRAEVQLAMNAGYPPLLRDAGLGGMPVVATPRHSGVSPVALVREVGRMLAEAVSLDRPAYVPATAQPVLTNGAEVQDLLNRSYPRILREAGVGGETVFRFHVDQDGQVTRTELKSSSGYTSLDAVAESIAGQMQFRPARNRDKAVSVWVEVPIRFEPV